MHIYYFYDHYIYIDMYALMLAFLNVFLKRRRRSSFCASTPGSSNDISMVFEGTVAREGRGLGEEVLC
jgi:hypothetical protein